MVYEIDPYKFTQDIVDDVVIIIPNLELDTNYRSIIYTLKAPSFISKDFLEAFFICGSFDTESIYKPVIDGHLRMGYTKFRGGKGVIDVNKYTLVPIKRGSSFSFRLWDSTQNIVSEI